MTCFCMSSRPYAVARQCYVTSSRPRQSDSTGWVPRRIAHRPRSTERFHRAFARADPARKRSRQGAKRPHDAAPRAFADAPWLAWEGYHCPMDCAECEDLSRRHALATDRHMEANKRRQAYVPGQPISGRDITELAHLDQEVEDTKRRRDDLAKEYARHRREAHPKGRAS